MRLAAKSGGGGGGGGGGDSDDGGDVTYHTLTPQQMYDTLPRAAQVKLRELGGSPRSRV